LTPLTSPLPLSSEQRAVLQGVRGIAALWIFIGHLMFRPVYGLGAFTSEGSGWLGEILFFRFLAVDWFLLLSGYVLTRHYAAGFTRASTGRQIDRFYLRRIIRLYPLYLLSLLLVGLYEITGVAHPLSAGQEGHVFAAWPVTLSINLLMMNAWGLIPGVTWNEPTWTISILFLCSILFPNLCILFGRFSLSLRATLLLMAAMLLGYCAVYTLVDMKSHSDATGAILRGLVFFFMGYWLARAPAPMSVPPHRWHNILLALLLLNAALMIVWFALGGFVLLPFHLSYPLLLLGLIHGEGPIHRFLRRPTLQWLGIISYALFVFHYPLLMLANHWAGDWLRSMATHRFWEDLWLYFVVMLPIIGLSGLLTRCVDQPLHRWLSRALGIATPHGGNTPKC